MTPRLTCATRRALAISRHQGLLSHKLMPRLPCEPLRAAAPPPATGRPPGAAHGGGPHQARHVVRAALAQLLALDPLAGQHAPRGVLRVRARHHHLPAARAPVTIRQPPQKRPSGLARLCASCSARSRVRGHCVAGRPACVGRAAAYAPCVCAGGYPRAGSAAASPPACRRGRACGRSSQIDAANSVALLPSLT